MKQDKSVLLGAIKEYLEILKARGILYYTKNTTYHRQSKGAVIAVNKLYGHNGAPDFHVFLRGGKTLHMHAPKRYEKLSKAQARYKEFAESLGHTYIEIRSIQDVEAAIKRYII